MSFMVMAPQKSSFHKGDSKGNVLPLHYYKPELSWQAIAKESPDSAE
ncbi:MAG: hypothetical protein RL158_322 [Bacteroidota bacterium]